MTDQIEILKRSFYELFGRLPESSYFCPGRVNLIGEHIDYNGGLVLPCAIKQGTYLLLAPNNENRICMHSMNYPETAIFDFSENFVKAGAWFDYPAGVLKLFAEQDLRLDRGYNFLFFGNLPISSGLSSSASIEIVSAFAFNDLLDSPLSKIELVQLAKLVENDFIGVQSGIMDQFAVTFAQADLCVKLNCQTLDYEMVPLSLQGYVLAIINTNKPRKLAESKYNERVEECHLALTALQQYLPIGNLCELRPETLFEHRALIKDAPVFNRARHVIEENDRVNQAAAALSSGKMDQFGLLMNQSHLSLKLLYEVSGFELDVIAEFSQCYPGVIGARMTGAGFGGCAIALVKEEVFERFSLDLMAYYEGKVGYRASVYRSFAGDGVGKL